MRYDSCPSGIRSGDKRLGMSIAEERSKMKKSRSVAKAIVPEKPTPGVTLLDEQGTTLPVESNLSPERMMEGVSTTTALLSQILAQQPEPHQLRDWGINE